MVLEIFIFNIAHCCLELLQVGEFSEHVGEDFGLGVLAVVETIEKSSGVWRDVGLSAETLSKINLSTFSSPSQVPVVILRGSVLQGESKS